MSSESKHTEEELLHRLFSGDTTAFTAIYQEYAPALVNFTASRLSTIEEARDIVHDLFVYLWEEKAQFQITHSLRAFLFAAIRYRIIDHIRKNSTRKEYAYKLLSLPDITVSAPEDNLDAKDLSEAIEKAVHKLPPRVQEIYRLSRHKHRSIAEIAKELNLSQQTVKNQLSTALSYLRTSFNKLISLFF